MKVVVRTGDPVPVLLSPDAATSSTVGALAGGVTVDITDIVTNATTRWAKLPLMAGDVQLLRSGTQEAQFGYIAGENVVGELELPPPATIRIGLSVIYSRASANLAAKHGCRFFSIIGNV